MSKKIGLYAFNGITGESCVTIQCLGSIKSTEKYDDTFLKEYIVQNDPKVVGYVYGCKIPEKQLMASKKQPILKINLVYEKSLVTALVAQLFVLFTITDDITSEEQLLHTQLKGYFSIDIISNNLCKTLDGTILKYPGNDEILKVIEQLTKHEMFRECINKYISNNEKERINKYTDGNDYTDIESPALQKFNSQK